MTDTTLDAAVLSGMMAVGGHPTNDEQRRTYARALVAELLRGMEQIPQLLLKDTGRGYAAALAEIRRRAGLEGEG
ncbi:MAG: hypothetical protein ACK5X3_05090 [Pseudomonadota bacterium]|jgi:hypothetical protein